MSEQDAQYQYRHDDEDEDNVAMKAMHDAGTLTEAAAAGDVSAALYEEGLELQTDAIISLMTGSFSASILVHVLADRLEAMDNDDIKDTEARLEHMLNNGTLTDAKKQEIQEYLDYIQKNPDLLNVRK